MKKQNVVLTVSIIIAASLGQNRGFPVQAQFENCIKPNHITQHQMDSTISDLYFHIRDNYIAEAQSTPNGYYVLSGMGTGGAEGLITHSEAHGYGMLTTVLMAGTDPLADPDAKKYFDGMYYFYNDHRSIQGEDLMSWQVLDDGYGGESSEGDYSAADGDMDIAYSLILAHYQWGSAGTINYLAEAKRIITNGIKEFDLNQETMRTTLGDWVYGYGEGGDWYYDEDLGEWVEATSGWYVYDEYYWGTRASDWMSGHMKAYQDVTGDPFWGEAADTIYALTENFLTNYSETGLVSDFVDGEYGEPAAENYIDEFPETNQYFENACRVPLRFAADFAHYGSPKAQSAVNGMVDFIRTKTNDTPADITWGYDITTGAELYPDQKSNRFTAPFIAGSIVDRANQQFLNDGWDYIASQRESYYSDYLTLLSMLLISGNWWPATETYNTAIADESPARARFSGVVQSVQGSEIALNFELDGTTAQVELFTVNGRKILSQTAHAVANGQFSAALDRSQLSESLYLVRVGNNVATHTTKLLLK